MGTKAMPLRDTLNLFYVVVRIACYDLNRQAVEVVSYELLDLE